MKNPHKYCESPDPQAKSAIHDAYKALLSGHPELNYIVVLISSTGRLVPFHYIDCLTHGEALHHAMQEPTAQPFLSHATFCVYGVCKDPVCKCGGELRGYVGLVVPTGIAGQNS